MVKGLAGGYAIPDSSEAKERLPDSAIRLAASEDAVVATVGVAVRYGATIGRTWASTNLSAYNWNYEMAFRLW